MTEAQAIQRVEQARPRLDVDPAYGVADAERAIVQYTRNRARPGKIEDRIAWIITLAGATGYALVHVDDRTGDILEVLQ